MVLNKYPPLNLSSLTTQRFYERSRMSSLYSEMAALGVAIPTSGNFWNYRHSVPGTGGGGGYKPVVRG